MPLRQPQMPAHDARAQALKVMSKSCLATLRPLGQAAATLPERVLT